MSVVPNGASDAAAKPAETDHVVEGKAALVHAGLGLLEREVPVEMRVNSDDAARLLSNADFILLNPDESVLEDENADGTPDQFANTDGAITSDGAAWADNGSVASDDEITPEEAAAAAAIVPAAGDETAGGETAGSAPKGSGNSRHSVDPVEFGDLTDSGASPAGALAGTELTFDENLGALFNSHGSADPSFLVVSVDPPVNVLPVGVPTIDDLTPTEGQVLTATALGIVDLNNPGGAVLPGAISFQWQSSPDGTTWTNVAGATAATFTPGAAEVGQLLRVFGSYTDAIGTAETIVSDPTTIVGDSIVDNGVGNALTGTSGQDDIRGNGGADTLIGLADDDNLDGGFGDDILRGGAGSDVLTGGGGVDTIDMSDATGSIVFTLGAGGNGAANLAAAGLGSDTYTGIENILGGSGADTLAGNTGVNAINAGAGNDAINYTMGGGADVVDGGLDVDTLNVTGAGAADVLDVIYNGVAITTIEGGAVSNVEAVTADLLGGTDTLSYAGTTAGVTVNLATSSATGFASIANIENVTGGSGADTLVGDGAANVLNGGAGVDILRGGAGSDVLTGGGGVDTIDMSDATGSIVFTLGAGGNGAANLAAAGLGSDTYTGIENILGGSGADTLAGNTGVNAINAGAGNDAINYTMGGGADVVDGGLDVDTLNVTGAGAADVLDVIYNGVAITTIEGGAVSNVEAVTADLLGGTDTLSYAGTTAGVTVNLATSSATGFASIANIENVTGGSGADTLIGNAAANILNGGAGADILRGGAGSDVLTGGSGVDTIDMSDATGSIVFTLGAGGNGAADLTAAGLGSDTYTGIENILGGSGADTLAGNTGVNAINAGAGNDTINYTMGGGADVVDGGLDVDTLNVTGAGAADVLDVIYNGVAITTIEGGAVSNVEAVTADLLGGTDTLSYAGTTAGVTVNLATSSATGFTSIANIENVTGGSGADTLAGSTGVNAINAGAGNDTINYTMGGGADVVDGGLDVDTLNVTGAGAADVLDVIYNGLALTTIEGGAVSNVEAVTADLLGGTDTLSYAGTTAGVTVNLATSSATGFTSIANIENVTGGSGADTLVGDGAANVLNGGLGADSITGGGGADTIDVGNADDNLVDLVIFGEATDGGDSVIDFDSNGTVTDDMIGIGGSLAIALDDVLVDDLITFASGNGANNGNTAVDLAGVEALFLAGVNGEGVSNGNLSSAAAVATEFNSEFGITSVAGNDALLVVNSTNSNNFSVWQYVEDEVTPEIQVSELTLFGVFTSNADVSTVQLDFVA